MKDKTTTKRLCIDWGNTRLKVGFFDNNKLEKEFNFSHDEGVDELFHLINDIHPDAAIFCSVTNHPIEIEQAIADETRLIILNSRIRLPFMNAYRTTETLGPDRLALVAGAQEHFNGEASLTISIGTAITYNFLQNGQIFRGGNITPGVELRLLSLHEHTDMLPLVSEKGETPLLGFDTESCIRSGVIWGIAAEVETMIKYYQAQYSCKNVVVTGGDLSLFDGKFKTQIFADSRILLKGLNSILNYNVR